MTVTRATARFSEQFHIIFVMGEFAPANTAKEPCHPRNNLAAISANAKGQASSWSLVPNDGGSSPLILFIARRLLCIHRN
jgi:hypothetical protein